MSQHSKTILVIDDEISIRESYKDFLEDHEYTVYIAENGIIGLDIFTHKTVDLVLLDLIMPKISGIEVLTRIIEISPLTPVIIISGNESLHKATEALRLGAWDYLLKPIENFEILTHAITNAFEKATLKQKNSEYKNHLEKMVEEQTNKLTTANRSLTDINTRMELALCGAELGTWDWHIPTGNIIFNERSFEMVGYSPNEIEPTFENWKKHIHPDDLLIVNNNLNEHLSGRTNIYQTEHRFKHKNGEWIWILNKGRIIKYDNNNKPLRACGTFLDITERKKAEQDLKDKEKKIKTINRKLDRYTYTVSHDLKEPLRSIKTFSDFIRKDYDTILNDEAKDYFNRIHVATNKMKQMIDDLLFLSKIENEKIEFHKASIKNIIEDVKTTLNATITQTKTDITYSNLPEIICQPTWIYTVFQNLISNSTKYSNNKNSKISINYTEQQDFHEFSIQDNGKGISKNQYKNIFNLFKKAHTDKNIEGSGVGLTIVSTIIKEHQGTIWVKESKADKGTTISFTISKKLKFKKDLPNDL